MVLLVIFSYFTLQYNQLLHTYQKYTGMQVMQKEPLHKDLQNNYLGERIAGMHFKYHTRVTPYDGWRPPLLDPLLALPYQLHGYREPFEDLSLKKRLELYKVLFPDKNPQVNCSCAALRLQSVGYKSFFDK